MGDSRKENAGLSLKWGIFKDKMHDFQVTWEILVAQVFDFGVK